MIFSRQSGLRPSSSLYQWLPLQKIHRQSLIMDRESNIYHVLSVSVTSSRSLELLQFIKSHFSSIFSCLLSNPFKTKGKFRPCSTLKIDCSYLYTFIELIRFVHISEKAALGESPERALMELPLWPNQTCGKWWIDCPCTALISVGIWKWVCGGLQARWPTSQSILVFQ